MWDADQETEMRRLHAGGVDWTREDFLWETIEPSKGSFNWSWPDKLMTSSSRTGVNVLAILDYSAKWASSGPNGESTYPPRDNAEDRKSTRLNSSHTVISYAVFCLKKKT